MNLSKDSATKVVRFNLDWLTVTRDGQEICSIKRQRGPFPRCAFVAWAAYRDGDHSRQEFKPRVLYKAAHFVSDVAHLFKVAPSIDAKDRAAFMARYLEGQLQPVLELTELMACEGCEYDTLYGNTCTRCVLCQRCEHHAGACSKHAGERSGAADAAVCSFIE